MDVVIDFLVLIAGILILVGGVAVLVDWRAFGTAHVPQRGRNVLGLGGEVVDPQEGRAKRWRLATACGYFVVGVVWIVVSALRVA